MKFLTSITAFLWLFLWCDPAISQTAMDDLLLRAYTDCLSLEKYATDLQKEFEQNKLTNQQLLEARQGLFLTHIQATKKHFYNMGWDEGMAEQLTIWNTQIQINILKEYNGDCEVIRNINMEDAMYLIQKD